ncbi:sugar ABC transporter permease [Microbacterium sp. EYE_5]|uniref:carbohydrate ABC transporter permease n=1 Tax=unclassified Microbacterium TaxID=2609290 RepID=UPI002003FB98|nr:MULTISPECIES: sugar ABC transporter permease [unclassified Microbacterium]MCK6080157.1 sugar ABC transporter permease [Microbacterium sp. EYE_382]MCK6085428.1 sugar ABC transporter permease [Microbacterium sp. EYE_384]MCK6122347.1 sugar ABC transporter permease [Microbacterium sp. EYE_80]MCK6126191.1 sugar ABC transporter permease [Microbacterium sp. EYE_79]MCK6141112.1 sugar ABC transporter permease [Microbacterium sp. EYE_39]
MTTQVLERPAPPRRRSGIQRRQQVGWLFIAPFLIVFAAFLVFPLIYAFGMSLFSSTLATGTKFVGADNYVKAFTDPLFLGGLGRVVLFAVVMIPAQLIVAIVAALVLDSLATWLSKLSRLLIFAPYAIPVVIGALMWSFLYSPRFGPATTVFGLFGLDAPSFLASDSIFFSLVNVVTWQWAGYYMIVVYAALRAIDPAVYEAARIDGANGFQIATRIKVPMISSSMVMVITFALIGTLQFFTEPTVLRSIASGALPADYTPNMYAYALAFSYSQFNYASTIAFSLGVLVFIGSFGFLFLTRKQNGLK